MDVAITPTAAGYIPLYDRMLSLTNAAESPGGMMLYLEVPSLTQYLLTVNKTGAGTGKVMSVNLPGGILCGTACVSDNETYNANTIVNLAAIADAGSVFNGWTNGMHRNRELSGHNGRGKDSECAISFQAQCIL